VPEKVSAEASAAVNRNMGVRSFIVFIIPLIRFESASENAFI
jgi:hypothetical protein